MVQILDIPGPQGGDQLVEVFRDLDLPIPELVIEVPKISSSSRGSCRRRVALVQQTAEQLVEVPTIVSVSSLHALVEQNVDIPVPHGRGGRVRRGGLQGLNQGHHSTAFGGAEHVDIPVPRGGGLQSLRAGQVSTASSSHSPGDADDVFTRSFRTFLRSKKSAALAVGTECGLDSVHAGS